MISLADPLPQGLEFPLTGARTSFQGIQGGGALALAAELQMAGVSHEDLHRRRRRRPPSRLETLKLERRFRLGRREERVRRSLEALEAEPAIRLRQEQWTSILEELKNEGF